MVYKDYYVKVSIEVWDTFDKVCETLKYDSYTKEYWKSFAPPDHVVYFMGPYSELGIKNTISRFEQLGCNPTFEVKEVVRVPGPTIEETLNNPNITMDSVSREALQKEVEQKHNLK